MSRAGRVASAVVALLASSGPAFGLGPSVVIFGGADGPENDQASIEAQVIQLSTVLRAAQPQVLFGGAAGQAVRESAEVDDTTLWLGRIFGAREGVEGLYRESSLGAKAASLSAFFRAIDRGQTNQKGTIVFGAGHGSGPNGDEPATLSLWTDASIPLDRLAHHLDRRKRRGPFAMVLGQCFSGSFSDLLHRGGHAEGEIAQPIRCVLAAAPHDRTASGCTSDVSDPWARAYLLEVAQALGQDEADLDGDGAVSLAEAHARAKITDRTTDVPVKSSETYVARMMEDTASEPSIGGMKPPAGASAAESALSFEDTIAAAEVEDRAVLLALAPSGDDPLAKAAVQKTELDRRAEAAEQAIADADQDLEDAERSARARVIARWPELSSPYRAGARALLHDHAGEVVDLVRGTALGHKLLGLERKVSVAAERWAELARQSARLERFLRTAAAVEARRRFLRDRGPRERRILERIEACERMIPLPR